jgi:hypothetical protein
MASSLGPGGRRSCPGWPSSTPNCSRCPDSSSATGSTGPASRCAASSTGPRSHPNQNCRGTTACGSSVISPRLKHPRRSRHPRIRRQASMRVRFPERRPARSGPSGRRHPAPHQLRRTADRTRRPRPAFLTQRDRSSGGRSPCRIFAFRGTTPARQCSSSVWPGSPRGCLHRGASGCTRMTAGVARCYRASPIRRLPGGQDPWSCVTHARD